MKTDSNTTQPQKKRMKRGVKVAVIIGIILGVLAVSAAITFAVITIPSVPVTIIVDYSDENLSGVIQLPDVTNFNDDLILPLINFITYSSDVKKSEACSALMVPVSVGSDTTVIMGRNMDYFPYTTPAWVFYGEADDRYRTFNMGYLGGDYSLNGLTLIPSMSSIAESGKIPLYSYVLLPYFVTDVINEKGLVIETNSREKCDKLACTGTNPEAEITICSGMLPRYLGDRCADIEEVLNLVATLNIYTLNDPDTDDQHFAFALMDASGRYGVLEFANNKIIWNEGQPGQTNFWIDSNADAISDSIFGLGRWQVLQESAKTITTESDMQDALKKVNMSQIFTRTAPDKITYDVIPDCVVEHYKEYYKLAAKLNHTNGIILDDGELEKVKKIVEEGATWNRTYLSNPENREKVLTWYNLVTNLYSQLPPGYLIENDLHKSSIYSYITVYSYVTTNKQPVLKVKFFEHDESYLFGFTNANENSSNSKILTHSL